MDRIQRVKRNGQITIPKEIREAIGLQGGDWIEVSIQGNEILVQPVDIVLRKLTGVARD